MSGIPYHLPGGYPVWRYTENGTLNWQVWTKPKDAAWFYFLLLGGAPGGGGGHSGALGSTRGGGGSGGCAAITRCWMPAPFVPKQLFIAVGVGGLGGAPTVNGALGSGTYMCVEPNTNPPNNAHLVFLAALSPGSAGSTGTAGAAGNLGGAGPINATTGTGSAVFSALGILLNFAGQNGALGGSHNGAAGGQQTWGSSGLPLCGGSGGAGTGTANSNFNGGEVLNTVGTILLPGGLAGGGHGQPGLQSEEPLIHTGGSGGGSNGTGTGGNGGDGSFGCGGGGGGAGITGGSGGKGGSGLVLIFAS